MDDQIEQDAAQDTAGDAAATNGCVGSEEASEDASGAPAGPGGPPATEEELVEQLEGVREQVAEAREEIAAAMAEMEVTAPTFPAEVLVSEFNYWLQKLPDGRMVIKFAGVVAGPMGNAPFPPAYAFVFAADGWPLFQENVAEERVKERPNIAVAKQMPPEQPGRPPGRVHLP